MIISLFIKLLLLAVLHSNPINNDGIHYIFTAQHFAEGDFSGGFKFFPMPAYPLLLAFVHIMIPDWIFTGYFISILSMVLASIPLYYTTKTMFGIKEGFWACIIFATLPSINGWSMYISRDPLFLALFSTCIFLSLVSLEKNKYLIFGITFVLVWISVLIRIESLVFIGFYPIVLIYFAIVDKRNRRSFLVRSLIWIGIPLTVVLLFFLSNSLSWIAVNRFDFVFSAVVAFFSGGFLDNYFKIYNFFSEAVIHPPFFKGHYSFAELCKHYIPFIYMLGILEAVVKVVLPSSFIPLYYGVKTKKKSQGYSGKYIFWIGILFAGLGYYFLISIDLIATRYLMIPAFLLLPWVGSGLKQMLDKVNTSSFKSILIFLIAVILLVPTIKTLKMISSRDTTTIHTVNWLASNGKISQTSIVLNNYKDSFYIDLKAQKMTLPGCKTSYYDKRTTDISIEKFAIEKDAAIIIVKVKSKNIDKIKKFQFYQFVNSFIGNKYTTLIYSKGGK